MKSPDRDAADEDHKRIWLSPRCDEYDERTWCEDDRGCCDDCGAPNTEYIRADIHASELATLRRRVAEMRRNRLEEAEALRRRVAEMEGSMAVPAVWSEAERDGMSQAYAKASTRHGHYESIFAAAAWLLRHRSLPPGRNEG